MLDGFKVPFQASTSSCRAVERTPETDVIRARSEPLMP